jgi:hypothetical protein
MKTFKQFLEESSQVMKHVKSFVKWADSEEGKKEFGAKLSTLHCEPGSCSTVSNALNDYLRKRGVNSKTITVKNPTNEKWLDAKDDEGVSGHHTVVQHGNHVIDLTRGQFDRSAPRIHVQSVKNFKKEWKDH